MADRYYLNSPLRPGLVLLQGTEARHLATVLRAQPGDRVCLFNGDGRDYLGHVVEIDRQRVTVLIEEVLEPRREWPVRLIVAAPLPKGDRADFLIEKLTELGVSVFVPLRTRRTVVQPRETKLERLQRAVIEASKQCGRSVLMKVRPLCDWPTFVQAADWPAQRFIGHPSGGELFPTDGDRIMAVGPEGGFTDDELTLAEAAGWQRVSLGPTILRVETAAIAGAVLTRPAGATPRPLA